MKIRPYQSSDFDTIYSWWKEFKEQPPLPSMIPIESSWILSVNEVPVMAVSLILTNIKEYAWIENFIRNPAVLDYDRHKASEYMINYIETQARALGYNRLLCLGYREKVMNRYQELGYRPTCVGLTSFVKEL